MSVDLTAIVAWSGVLTGLLSLGLSAYALRLARRATTAAETQAAAAREEIGHRWAIRDRARVKLAMAAWEIGNTIERVRLQMATAENRLRFASGLSLRDGILNEMDAAATELMLYPAASPAIQHIASLNDKLKLRRVRPEDYRLFRRDITLADTYLRSLVGVYLDDSWDDLRLVERRLSEISSL